MQSDAGGLGQFVQLDDVTVTDLDKAEVVYGSTFDDWSQAKGWMTETPLVFGWNTKPDPRSTFTFPWQWQTTAEGDWHVVETDNVTSGMSGYYTAVAPASAGFTALGGASSGWAADGGYDYWSWLRTSTGTQSGLVFRAHDANNARYSDGGTGAVGVTWPAITTAQLATATTSTVNGPGRGTFTIRGVVAGTDLTIPVLVTVMPNLTTRFTVTGSYDLAKPSVPNQTPGTGTFNDGTASYTDTTGGREIGAELRAALAQPAGASRC